MRLAAPLLPALALLAGLPATGTAQVKASEPATVVQTVDGTKFAIEYFRPRVRGRDSIWEAVIFPEKVWTPGANWATTFEVSKRIQLNGLTLEAGKYSVWFDLQQEPWIVILDPRHRRFHTNHPDSTAEQVRIGVTPERGPFTEVLTWAFPELRVNGGKLQMNFGDRQVSFDFRVEPSYELTMPQPAARPFSGRYALTWAQAPGDTTKPKAYTFGLAYRNGSLKGKWETPPWPGLDEFVLIPLRPTWFIIADLQNGEVYDVTKEMVLEFDVNGGKATGFTVRGDGDEVWGTGVRQR